MWELLSHCKAAKFHLMLEPHVHRKTVMTGKEVKVAQLCLAVRDPVDYTACGIVQARILEWAAIPFSRGSS